MGLIRPTEGRISIFGHAAAPGAPVLSRLGSFVEGTGLQPHLSGRDNLTLYWAATGRPLEDAHMAEAIEVAGLGTAIDKRVRSYSQGMRQRVAIAQAMLGLPDLLVLDEPTNGLDPPQIHAMREVLRSYAATGRTVHRLQPPAQRDRADLQPRRRHGEGAEDRAGHGRGDRRHRGAVLVGLADDADTARAIAVLEEPAGGDRRTHRRGAGGRPRRHQPRGRCRRSWRPASTSTSSRRVAGWRTRSWRWWGRTHECPDHRARAADRGRRGVPARAHSG